MMDKTEAQPFRERWTSYITGLQESICTSLAAEDGKALFTTDSWERNEAHGGGGITKTMTNGNVFEKAGVNTSVVHGEVTKPMRELLKQDAAKWFAAGLSLVIHPVNPYVPTIHANWRYFELYNDKDEVTDRWFGGGTDLTPYYLFEEDVMHFHQILKTTTDAFGTELYPLYKQNCDEYFVNKHRDNEMRGIGGIFYEQLRASGDDDAERIMKFQQAQGNAFLDSYLPIVNKRKNTLYSERERGWQEIRRGRYVEFNLLHDRGTIFGLKTQGRTESILMSLPPRARWVYDHHPDPGSPEEKLLQACTVPRDWLASALTG